MPRYRVTIGLRQGRFGATETYITPDTTPTALGATVQQLIDLRKACLFDVDSWDGVRIGQADLVRRAQIFPPGEYTEADAGINLVVPGRGSIAATLVERRPDQARACLHIRVNFGDQRSTLRYFSLIPDSIVVEEPRSIRRSLDGLWDNNFIAFATFLKTGQWAIRARLRTGNSAPVNITRWSQQVAAPFHVGVSVPTATAKTIVAGDRVSLNAVRRRGTDRVSYNGIYVVESVNTTAVLDHVTYYLRGTEGANPDSVKRQGTISHVAFDYFPMLSFYPIRAGVHKRGNGINPPRGRRVTRMLLT